MLESGGCAEPCRHPLLPWTHHRAVTAPTWRTTEWPVLLPAVLLRLVVEELLRAGCRSGLARLVVGVVVGVVVVAGVVVVVVDMKKKKVMMMMMTTAHGGIAEAAAEVAAGTAAAGRIPEMRNTSSRRRISSRPLRLLCGQRVRPSKRKLTGACGCSRRTPCSAPGTPSPSRRLEASEDRSLGDSSGRSVSVVAATNPCAARTVLAVRDCAGRSRSGERYGRESSGRGRVWARGGMRKKVGGNRAV